MAKAVDFYNRFSCWIEKTFPFVSGSLIVLASFLMIAEVVSRYVFQASHGFMDEIPRYLVVWATFLMAPVLVKLGLHVSVDVLPTLLKGRKRDFVKLTIHLLTLVASLYLFLASLGGVSYHLKAGTLGFTEIKIPLWTLFLSLSIGSALLVMYSLELSCRSLLAVMRIRTTVGETEGC